MQEAGTSLSKVSENESASAEELAATSEQLAESNATDTAQVAAQASAINDMVDEMSRLLQREE